MNVEGVVNGGVDAEKALGGSSQLEALQLALASSHRLMRVFRPIVIPQPLLMRTGKPETPKRRRGIRPGIGNQPGDRIMRLDPVGCMLAGGPEIPETYGKPAHA